MALPTLTKTWQHNLNNQTPNGLLADNRAQLLAIVGALRGFASSPATVRYSCNSTVAGTPGDGVNRWTTAANLVWANPGTAHSWMVLYLPGAGVELLLSCEVAVSYGANLLVATSVAGFAGGSTTLRPTAVDEVVLASATLFSNNAGSQRWSVQRTADGEQTRIIICHSGAGQSLICVDKPANVTAGWSNPYVLAAATNLTVAGLSGVNARVACRAAGAQCDLSLTCEGTASSTIVNSPTYGIQANELSGEWPIAPIGLVGLTTGARGRHGSLVDMWWGSSGASSGDTYPTSSPQLAQFGNLIIPWDGVTTPALS